MSSADLLEKIESLPKDERLWLFERLSELSEPDVPESLRQSLGEADRGELISLDEALSDIEST